ncbi:MAG: TetR/AcrR family transcriptional regulator [Anaerolineales bacterium]
MDDPGSRRGRTHNAENTREIILDAAERVFAEHGFDGARIDAIAAVAGYNKSLIFQYYGDKLGLYAEVIRRADDQTRALQNEALSGLMQADKMSDLAQIKELLGFFIGWYFDYLLEHPHIQRIYMWEMAEGWQTFSKILSQRDFDDIDQFGPVLNRLQQAGFIRPEPDPLLQLSGAIFVNTLYLALPPLYKSLMPNMDLNSPAALASTRQFLIDFIVNGLLIAPSEAKP